MGFPSSSAGKESTCNAGDPGSIPGSGRSTGEGIGYPLQYSCLENSMDCIVHEVTKSQTQQQLSLQVVQCFFHYTQLFKFCTHSSHCKIKKKNEKQNKTVGANRQSSTEKRIYQTSFIQKKFLTFCFILEQVD